MTDIVSPKVRSKIMSHIRSKNTKPEILVRKWLHAHGFRFRIHRKDLLGCPDVVLPKYRIVIFVHGCFWHQHEGCINATIPETRREWWLAKFKRTKERDKEAIEKLQKLGWQVLIIWECQVKTDEYKKNIEKLIGAKN